MVAGWGENKPLNINILAGLFWDWAGVKKLFTCLFRPLSCGERGKHINEVFRAVTIPGKYLLIWFIVHWFLSPHWTKWPTVAR